MATYTVVTYHDRDNNALFVDITTNPILSLNIHVANAVWMDFVKGSTLERFSTLADAEDAKENAVEAHRPLFNTWADEETRGQMLVDYLTARGRVDLLAADSDEG